jgi:bacillithiol system protein YtxJ
MAIKWNQLNTENQLEELVRDSFQTPQLIFKHSTRCSISAMALNRLEREGMQPSLTYHLLDLIAFRALSLAVAQKFTVHHESPQVLLLKNGDCIYDESHLAINASEIREHLSIPENNPS